MLTFLIWIGSMLCTNLSYFICRISVNSYQPWIVSSYEYFLQKKISLLGKKIEVCGNYLNFQHFTDSKKKAFCGNYSWKYGFIPNSPHLSDHKSDLGWLKNLQVIWQCWTEGRRSMAVAEDLRPFLVTSYILLSWNIENLLLNHHILTTCVA